MDKPKLYPIQFVPQLKEKVWGGAKLHKLLHKEAGNLLGESWEISGVEGSLSRVSNGALKGLSLPELLNTYKEELVGENVYKRYGNEFPLLFKFIDAKQDLSVQLHPNDELAKARHDSFGKTEMWYILQADKDAKLILGFNKKITKEQYIEVLEKGAITTVLHAEPVKQGETFFIAPGTVHAIGEGILLAEIQQTSDITYRIYDWDRPDTDGKQRQLHTDEALDAINFDAEDSRISYSEVHNKRILLKDCPYFVTHKLTLTESFSVEDFRLDSCKVYMCVSGNATLIADHEKMSIRKGQTVLVPASCKRYTFETENATLLEVYIP